MDSADYVHGELNNNELFVPAKRRAHKKRVCYLRPYQEDTRSVREPLFPDSPYISYSYQEHDRKHETIISHEGTHDRLPAGRRGLTFARAIEALQNTLTRTDTRLTPLSKDNKMHESILRDIESAWRIIMPAKASKEQGSVTHGMHINISVYTKHIPDPEPWAPYFYEHGLSKAYNEGLWLLNSSPSAVPRLDERNQHSHRIGDAISERGDYTEIELPPADCNPYYATLLALVGVLHAHAIERSEAGTAYFAIPKIDRHTYEENAFNPTARSMRKRFTQGEKIIVSTLNDAEPGLGDRFARALARTPPGREPSAARLASRSP